MKADGEYTVKVRVWGLLPHDTQGNTQRWLDTKVAEALRHTHLATQTEVSRKRGSDDAQRVRRHALGDDVCEGSDEYAIISGATLPCAECGRRLTVLSTGRMPVHKPLSRKRRRTP